MAQTLHHWINNAPVPGNPLVDCARPADGGKLGSAPVGSREIVDEAVKAAGNALTNWRRTPLAKRCELVTDMADWLVARYGEAGKETPLKRLIIEEVGKPLPEADIEVIETSDFLRYFATEAPHALHEQEPTLDQNLWSTKRAILLFEPVGVVGIIKPWNYPLEMIGWTLGPTLVAGNTCVIKPSERSPLTADTFAQMAADVGLPPGVLNITYGDATTGQALASHPSVNMVSFTGSFRAGRYVARACADRLARASLELSGNDAAIVLSDADLEMAANGLVWGAFCNAGQVCVGVKRAYVMRQVYDDIARLVVSKTKALRPSIDYGPVISESQLGAIETLVEDSMRRGAKALAGGHRGDTATYYSPTVLSNVPSSALILDEECFGPVLPLIPVDSAEEAVRLANASDYGLGASIWTSNLERGIELARELEAGMVWVNDVNVAFPQAPWAGVKQSGLGFELSHDSIKEYTVRKHINIETSSDVRRAWWYPYE